MTAHVVAEGVGVRFLFDRHRRVVTPGLARLRRRGLETWGLRGVDFAIGPGEGVALLGASGSGKTSLLRTIAGVLEPDEGRLSVAGRIAPLLATDAGLVATLTGRENAMLLGVLGGSARAETRERLETVRARSGLGDAFDRPVSSYSQGMKARLSFAATHHGGTEVVLLDEVHEALDHRYRAALAVAVDAVRAAGGIVVAAGHDHALLERLCSRALLLEAGRVVVDGPFRDVQRRYLG